MTDLLDVEVSVTGPDAVDCVDMTELSDVAVSVA